MGAAQPFAHPDSLRGHNLDTVSPQQKNHTRKNFEVKCLAKALANVCASATLPSQTVGQKRISMTRKASVERVQFSRPKAICPAFRG